MKTTKIKLGDSDVELNIKVPSTNKESVSIVESLLELSLSLVKELKGEDLYMQKQIEAIAEIHRAIKKVNKIIIYK